MDQEMVVKSLSSSFDDVAVGGGGRYLILRLPRERKLAVFDVNEADVVHYIPLAEDNSLFAAGMNDLIVYLPLGKLFQRLESDHFPARSNR